MSGIVVKCPPSRPTLDHFNFMDVVLGVGAQTDEEYSTNGRTRVLYAISRMAGDFVLILRFINARDRLADVHIFWMWS